MAGCGYVCPLCEGQGFTDEGKECDYCKLPSQEKSMLTQLDKDQWIKDVHEGPCCSDDR